MLGNTHDSAWTEQVWKNKIAEYLGKRGQRPTKEEVVRVANQWINELQCLKVQSVIEDLGED